MKFPLFIRGEETDIKKKENLSKQKIERWTIKINKNVQGRATTSRTHSLCVIEGGGITQLIRVIID
jgi:hypothetical protein